MSMPPLLEYATNHNVYILGAGFSRDAGAPLVADFIHKLRESVEWLDDEGRTTDASAVRRVLQFRKEAASAAQRTTLQPDNIEQLFSLAVATPMTLWTRTGEGDAARKLVGGEIERAIAATIDSSVGTSSPMPVMIQEGTGTHGIGGAQRPDSAKPLPLYDHYVSVLLGAYGGLSRQQFSTHNTFITFNYDLVLENALWNLDLVATYGLPKVSFDSEAAGLFDSHARGEGEIRVFKIHGSMNWQRKEGTGDILVSDAYMPGGSPPLLLPPTWQKTFGNDLRWVWDSAVGALRTATRIVIVGFSLPETDVHFRYLLGSGLQENISLRRILVIDPSSGEETFHRRLRAVFDVDQVEVIVICEPLRRFLCDRDHPGLKLLNRGRPEGLVDGGLELRLRESEDEPDAYQPQRGDVLRITREGAEPHSVE